MEEYRIKENLGVFQIQAKLKIIKYKYYWFPYFGREIEEWQTLRYFGVFKSLKDARDMIKKIRKGIIYHGENT